MNCPNINDLTNELKELINLTSLPLEQKASIFNWCYQFLSTLNRSIEKIEDLSDIDMQRIQKIKKDKKSLNPYIKHLKGSEEYLRSIGDIDNASIIAFDRTVLELFQTDSMSVLNIFSDVNNVLLSLPDASYNIRILKEKKRLTPSEKKYLMFVGQYKRLAKIAKFFDGYDVTPKILVTAASIYLFKAFIEFPNVQKYKLKEKLEYLLFQYEESIQIRPDEMDDVYLKTVFNTFPVFAYETDTDRRPAIDIAKIEARLQLKISTGNSKQKAIRNQYLQKQFQSLKINLFEAPHVHP